MCVGVAVEASRKDEDNFLNGVWMKYASKKRKKREKRMLQKPKCRV